jgi:hypothetical protein
MIRRRAADRGVVAHVPLARRNPVSRTALMWSTCLLAAAFTTGAAEAPVLTMEGLGPIRIGMTRAQVESVAGAVKPDELYDPAHPDYCWQGAARDFEDGWLMFEEGRLVALTVGEAYATRSGVRVGMSEAQAQAIYGGRLLVEPHQYDEHGHYLKLFSHDRRRALVLETDGRTVLSMTAGDAEPAQYVEGCL